MKHADQENLGSDLWLISPIKFSSVMSRDLDEGRGGLEIFNAAGSQNLWFLCSYVILLPI